MTVAIWAYVTPAGQDTTPGDFNSDGNVDAGDYRLWTSGDPRADADLDGDVDIDDFAMWQTNSTNVLVVSRNNRVVGPPRPGPVQTSSQVCARFCM